MEAIINGRRYFGSLDLGVEDGGREDGFYEVFSIFWGFLRVRRGIV